MKPLVTFLSWRVLGEAGIRGPELGTGISSVMPADLEQLCPAFFVNRVPFGGTRATNDER